MAHLALALLGPFQVTLHGRPVEGLTSDHLRALLAYLAVESGREHSREQVAALLWRGRPLPPVPRDAPDAGRRRGGQAGRRDAVGGAGTAELAEARECLVAVYRRFSEGIAFPDLQEAAVLIGEAG